MVQLVLLLTSHTIQKQIDLQKIIMTLNKNITEEDIINSFVEQILSEDADFQFMSEDEQAKIYGIYQLLLTAVHRAVAHDNVYPVVYANDYNSKKVVENAISNVKHLIPEISRITVSLVH